MDRRSVMKGVAMGKSTVELPEIAEAPPEGAPAGTDDLLAQLAGQEIDRLLAEADADRPSATAPSVAPAILPPAIAETPALQTPPATEPPVEVHEKLLPDLDAPRAEEAIGE